MEHPPPFVIFALPRSRTTWLSKFLSYGEWKCGHDEARHTRSIDDVRSWLSQPFTGTVETAAAPFWRLLHAYSPQARIAVVRRDVEEVTDSLIRQQPHFDRQSVARQLRRLDQKLTQIERRVPGILSVDFCDLGNEDVAGALFQHCLQQPMDRQWFAATSPINVQTDLDAVIRHYIAYRPQLAKLCGMLKQAAIAGMARSSEIEGITYQQEPFDSFYVDAKALFRAHLLATEQSPDAYLHKNIPLLRVLDQIGALSITTARSNGRMFGYLMNVISPSLDDPTMLTAINTIFYASPEVRGLGTKLQRASLEYLSSCGIGEVVMRAGVRGSGPKMGAMYRRLGANDFGHLYKMQLGVG